MTTAPKKLQNEKKKKMQLILSQLILIGDVMVEFVAEGNLMYVGVGWFVFMVQIY